MTFYIPTVLHLLFGRHVLYVLYVFCLPIPFIKPKKGDKIGLDISLEISFQVEACVFPCASNIG